MNGSDVRKFIKKGELAVTLLETLGYEFVDNQKEHPHWVAPVKPIDGLMEQLEALIKAGVEEGIKAGVEEGIKARVKEDPRGPNWHLVAPMVGKNFKVRPDCIPLKHHLRQYAFGPHFQGRLFRAEEIRYHRSEEYTGYAVLFHFNTRPYRPEVVWLPLSAVAFSN